ncbi:3-oxoadipate enol-lactonase [Mycobacterium camsae]|uniref:3-oxoadipate enol-lactonase n=1 Tax=Mycobacterium gordonae TaxID=1778 RepID=UPI00197CD54B|nr:3-oxoadipate enol-lactonase [Mycobacterium gordonae]
MSAVEVRAIDSGRRDGHAVVLSNSLGATHRMWDAQIGALERHFRVLRYDTRGHGASPVPDGPYCIEALTDDVVALLDRFRIERAHLVGLSLGGMTALNLAARNPERVNRIVVLCTAVQLAPASAWTQRAALVRAQGTGAVAPSVVQRWFTRDYLRAHPAVAAAHESMVAATPAEGYAACCEAISAVDLRAALSSVRAPTLAVAGADDPATPPARLEEIVAGLGDSRLLVLNRAAHLANAERPTEVSAAIVDHLQHR